MAIKNIQHPEIGEIQLVHNAAAKYLRISLKPFGGVRVSIPGRASIKEAMAFVEQKKDWILATRSKMAAQEQKYTLFTPETDFTVRDCSVRLFPWKSEQFRAQLTKNVLKIFYPQDIDVTSAKAQETIRFFINEMIRKEAKAYLPGRTEELARLHGFSYRGVTVKNVTSRWGSCSASNHINLNIHLMRLPDHLTDYVILHELTHTIHKNHGSRFWECLNEHTDGKARQLAAEMKQFSAVRY